jgi:hypothetical protein
MKQLYFCFCFSIFSINTFFSQDVSSNDSIPKNSAKVEIGYIDLYAGGAFGYVDGFAGGVNLSFLYSNVLFTLGFVSNNEQGGLEYVDNANVIPLNYYKHYRIDNIPLMIGFYHPFRSASLSASAGVSLSMYSEYVDVNTFSIFNSNATEIYSNNTIGFPYEVNLKLFSKNENAFIGYGLKLFGNLGKYNYTGLALVLSLGSYK